LKYETLIDSIRGLERYFEYKNVVQKMLAPKKGSE
jgi:hypothetical protein